tara:strand:- start:728 stop:1252 length:525 start_codon:yes stop_codon:yes gene_type:complete
MIKLKQILLNELEKNKWEDLDSGNIEQFKKDLLSIVKNAYSKIGGHPAVKSASDIPGKIHIWQAIDVDDEPDADATIGFKKRPAGNKLVVMGQDGSKAAKRAVVSQVIKYLKKKGWYAEVSKDLVDKFGLKPIDDESRVRKILKGKDIEWLEKGYYNRSIGGKSHKKVLVGNPK